MLQIKLEDVRQVYRGRHGCCCGCKGTHSYPTHNVEEGGIENVDDVQVAKILSYMNKKLVTEPLSDGYTREGLNIQSDYVAFGTKTQLTIVYLKKGE
jgi:hypothetical protein